MISALFCILLCSGITLKYLFCFCYSVRCLNKLIFKTWKTIYAFFWITFKECIIRNPNNGKEKCNRL